MMNKDIGEPQRNAFYIFIRHYPKICLSLKFQILKVNKKTNHFFCFKSSLKVGIDYYIFKSVI
jgi:hypothetical protein